MYRIEREKYDIISGKYLGTQIMILPRQEIGEIDNVIIKDKMSTLTVGWIFAKDFDKEDDIIKVILPKKKAKKLARRCMGQINYEGECSEFYSLEFKSVFGKIEIVLPDRCIGIMETSLGGFTVSQSPYRIPLYFRNKYISRMIDEIDCSSDQVLNIKVNQLET